MGKANKRKVKANRTSLLADVLTSKGRAEIFRLLFGLKQDDLYIREMERLSGLSVATIRSELIKLAELGLVVSRRDGNRVYYRAEKAHPLFPEIHGLVLKTVGLVDVLRSRLEGADLQVAFVFGSIAQGREGAESDVDLFIVGEVGLRKVSLLLDGVSDQVFREVNPFVIPVDEFRTRVRNKEHFVSSVLQGSKLYIIGDDAELEELGK